MVPNSSYQVTSNHNVIQFKIKNSVTTTESQHTAEMNKGSYTFNELASEFIRALNASDASETFTITTSDTTFTYELSWDTSNTILFLCVISIVYSYIGLIEQNNSKYPLMIYVLNTVSLLLTTYLISNNILDIIFNHFMILLIAINYYRYRNERKTTMYFVHIYS